MGKPRSAEIQAAYSVLHGEDPASVKAEAVRHAEAAGWQLAEPDAEVVQGTKRFETGSADIGIYFNEEEGEELLLIRLEHDFNHPTE